MKILNYFISMMHGRGGTKPSFKRYMGLVGFIVMCIGFFKGGVDPALFNAFTLFVAACIGLTSLDNLTAKSETTNTSTSTFTSSSITKTDVAEIVNTAGDKVMEILTSKEK